MNNNANSSKLKKNDNNSKKEVITEEIKGNKFLIALSNLFDPVNTPLAFGPKILKFNWIINAQKTGTIFVMFLLMVYYKNYSTGAWLYLSLHGTYGLLWFLKDMVFPDKSFQEYLTVVPSLLVSLFLLSYWIMGYEVMCGLGDQNPSGKKIFGCFFIFSIGNILMMCADLQKFITLKYKKGLIDDFFLKNNRNTNYFGEILVYLTFAMACGRKEGYIMLIIEWILFFGSRIYLKDLRLARKHGFEVYKKHSYIILFKFFENDLMNFILYLLIIFGIVCFIYVL
jgi:protein-S-isoprenylcysteine O-methyltransferase Ste14